MRVTFCCTDTNAKPWLLGLRAALPGAEVELWSPGASAADYAVVWAPPQTFFDEQPALKGIFNIGAGVDALMGRLLPMGVPVVRLDDAGMSVQMAEYVCHAVIRHYREFDAYEADTAGGKWSYRKPRARADFPVGLMGLGVLGERVALNFIQRLSGIATLTSKFCEAVKGTRTRIVDTRKTTPGWRWLEKAAVRAGGGTNHRTGLYDMAMVKDFRVILIPKNRRAKLAF